MLPRAYRDDCTALRRSAIKLGMYLDQLWFVGAINDVDLVYIISLPDSWGVFRNPFNAASHTARTAKRWWPWIRWIRWLRRCWPRVLRCLSSSRSHNQRRRNSKWIDSRRWEGHTSTTVWIPTQVRRTCGHQRWMWIETKRGGINE